jgi:hypothetical protein
VHQNSGSQVTDDSDCSVLTNLISSPSSHPPTSSPTATLPPLGASFDMAPSSPLHVDSEEGSQVSNSPSRSLSRRSADGATEDNKAGVAPPQPQPPAQNAQEAVDTFPGWRPMNGRESEGVSDVVDTLKLLNDAGVFGCVVGVNALRYYGAGRVIWVGRPCTWVLLDSSLTWCFNAGMGHMRSNPLV